MDWTELQRVYDEFVTGMRVVPGMWRPHAEWEQVAWISPPWSDEGYLWLDFPEVIMVGDEFLYAGHGPLDHPAIHHGPLPKAPWYEIEAGITFDRVMPNGLAFGGKLTRGADAQTVHMSLYVRNGTSGAIHGLKMQTCAYLRQLNGFDDRTLGNKYVHVAGKGWVSLADAGEIKEETGTYRLGWRKGPAIADLPLIVSRSSEGERLVAMTWHEDTYSMVSNPNHPCMHADPAFPDLAPGEAHSIQGELIFFEGSLSEFERQVLPLLLR